MLRTISFGTFYFFFGETPPIRCGYAVVLTCGFYTAFCLVLLIWVWFFVPETKGVPIEEMDKIFGGNSGQQDLRRIADIRRRLNIPSTGVQGADYDPGQLSDVDELAPKQETNIRDEWVEETPA
jgi:hypothetical protein